MTDKRLENKKKDTTRMTTNIKTVAVVLFILFLSNNSTNGFRTYAMKNDNRMGIKTILRIYRIERRANITAAAKMKFEKLFFPNVT